MDTEATVAPRSRAEFVQAYVGMEKADLAIALEMASTPAEVDAAAHLTLVLFDVAGAAVPFTDDRGRAWPALHRLVMDARGRVHGFPDSSYQSIEDGQKLGEEARREAIRRRREIYTEREARIARIGFVNAKGGE
jgi:hypothetical protein